MWNDFDYTVALYQSQLKANPTLDPNTYTLLACGWGLVSVNYDFMAIVPNLEPASQCGKCIKVTSSS